ncbi:37S ribosomal protein S16, mitochondrial [Hanseniaspora uvarum DSM 2768]|nr:37S ribosomal protein S16, mitochondrial [Hanseniaspora uvarum DSM 2768]
MSSKIVSDIVKKTPEYIISVQRLGKSHSPEFNIVVKSTETKQRNKTMPIEVLGYFRPKPIYDAETETFIKKVELDFDRCKYWVSIGSELTKPVFDLFDKAGFGAFGKNAEDRFYLKKADPKNGQIVREAEESIKKINLDKWRKEFVA